MSSRGEPSKVAFTGGQSATFLVRWHGRQEGPYSTGLIEDKLSANEIGLLHEILHNGEWMTIRDYLAGQEANRRLHQRACEEQERRERDEALRKAREIKAQQQSAAFADKVQNAPRPRDVSRGPIFDSRLTRRLISGLIVLAAICVSVWLVNYCITAIHKTDMESAMAKENIRLQAEYNKQRVNVNMKDATEKAWKQMQLVEFQAASDNPDPVTYFARIALGYSQLDVDDADPELKSYILKRVDAAKAARTVFESVNKELQESESGRNDIANIGQLFGTALGAILSSQKESNVTVESGIQLGQFFGRLAGSVAGQATISDKDVLSKYSAALQNSSETYQGLSRERSQLGKKLGEKYQIVLIDAAN